MKSADEQPDESTIDAAAAEWLIKQDREPTPAEQDEFLQWLASDLRHRVRFARLQRTWRQFDLLVQWRPEHSSEPNPDLLARRKGRSRHRAYWAGIGLAAGLAGAFALREVRRQDAPVWPSHFATAQAYERHALEDGSVIEQNAGAEVSYRYGPHERRIWLMKGEAKFTVAKDPLRPFVVQAAAVGVRATGTEFDVRIGTESVDVLVVEGKVRVDQNQADANLAERFTAPDLTAGHIAIVSLHSDGGAPQVLSLSGGDVKRLMAWQPRMLDFASTPLAEVVRQFNASNTVKMVINDPDLNGIPIVASFRSDNVDGFVRLLEVMAGIHARRVGPLEIVLSKNP